MIKIEIYLKSGAHFHIFVDSFTVKKSGLGDFAGLEWKSTSEKLPHLLYAEAGEIAAIVSTHEGEE